MTWYGEDVEQLYYKKYSDKSDDTMAFITKIKYTYIRFHKDENGISFGEPRYALKITQYNEDNIVLGEVIVEEERIKLAYDQLQVRKNPIPTSC